MSEEYTRYFGIPLEVFGTGITDAGTFNEAMEKLDAIFHEGGVFGDPSWKDPVVDLASLPSAGNTLGDVRQTLDDGVIYRWNGTIWEVAGAGALTYEGTWNASTNTPTLADGTGSKGHYYVVSTGGSQDLGSGLISFSPADWVVHNGSIWEKADHTDTVSSVFSRLGVVVAQAGDYTHAQIGSVGTDDHHAQIHTHASHIGIGIDDHHARDHRASHILVGPDAFLPTDLLDALVRRLRETGGPTDLLVGAVPDGSALKRSGTSIIGDPGAAYRCWSSSLGSATTAGFNSGSTTPTIMRIKVFPGSDIFGIPVRACIVAESSSGNAGYADIYRPSNGTIIATIGPITATTPTLYSLLPPWANPWPTTEEVLHLRVYRGPSAATITVYDVVAGVI
jgi:hypothetical protein